VEGDVGLLRLLLLLLPANFRLDGVWMMAVVCSAATWVVCGC
jgi:hypothetical protein